MDARFVRYHPAFPTTAEAAANYDLITSDHVPLLADIDGLVILTWNVLQFDTGNGFASLEDGLKYNETETQQKARHARIVAAIKRFVDLHHPIFIALQEITDKDPQLLDAILAALGDEWGCVHRDDGTRSKTGGVTTLFRKNAFNDVPEYREITNPIGTCSTHFTLLNGKTGRLLNVHPMYSQIIANAEKGLVEYLLDRTLDDDYAIVAGDFNAHIAPITERPQCITTSVAAPFFRNPQTNPNASASGARQGAAAVDGVFYSKRAASRVVTQADCLHLDPVTGGAFLPQQLPLIPSAGLPDGQREELTLPRMIISLDHRIMQQKVIDNKFTLPEYQQFLQEKYGSKFILVRLARDLNNQPYIAIAYPSILLKQMRTAELRQLHQNILMPLGREYKYDDDYSKKRHSIIYIPVHAFKLGEDNLPIYDSPSISPATSTDASMSDSNSESEDDRGFFEKHWPLLVIIGVGILFAAGVALSGGLSIPAIAAWPFVQALAVNASVFFQMAILPEAMASTLIGVATIMACAVGALAGWGITAWVHRCFHPDLSDTKQDKAIRVPPMPLVDLPATGSPTGHRRTPSSSSIIVPRLNLAGASPEALRAQAVIAIPHGTIIPAIPGSSDSNTSVSSEEQPSSEELQVSPSRPQGNM
jgi:hypothetical protein